MGDTDCWHRCCNERTDPFHDHFLSPSDCPRCASTAAGEPPSDEPPTWEELGATSLGTKPHAGRGWAFEDGTEVWSGPYGVSATYPAHMNRATTHWDNDRDARRSLAEAGRVAGSSTGEEEK